MTMKIKLLVLLLLSSLGTYAQQIEWMTLSEALEAQKKEPKKILWMYTQNGVVLVSCWYKKTFSQTQRLSPPMFR